MGLPCAAALARWRGGEAAFGGMGVFCASLVRLCQHSPFLAIWQEHAQLTEDNEKMDADIQRALSFYKAQIQDVRSTQMQGSGYGASTCARTRFYERGGCVCVCV